MKKRAALPAPVAAVAGGVLGTAVCGAVLCGILAAAVLAGLVPQGAMAVLPWPAAALSAFAGSIICAKTAGEKRLPLCLTAAAVYLLLAFVARGFLFGGVGERPWVVPLCTAAGALLGAMAASGGRKRRR